MPKKRLEDMTEPELGALMTTLASTIEYVARELRVEKPLFALVVFNHPKVGQYISNAMRSDVIRALRETADRLERREDVTR